MAMSIMPDLNKLSIPITGKLINARRLFRVEVSLLKLAPSRWLRG